MDEREKTNWRGENVQKKAPAKVRGRYTDRASKMLALPLRFLVASTTAGYCCDWASFLVRGMLPMEGESGLGESDFAGWSRDR